MLVPWSEIAAHRERLVRIARSRVPTREDAEDVAQEAMLRCATFSDLDEERLAQFLTAVTIRLCADVHRQVDRGSRLARRLDLDEAPTPEELACAASDAELVRDVLRALPEKQRLVLVDRAEGLSVTQISRRHSLTYKGVESALSRARAQMRTALAAAMALLWGAAEFLRRRPSLESAVPVATVAVAATVLPFLAAGGGDHGVGRAAAPRSRGGHPVVGVDTRRPLAVQTQGIPGARPTPAPRPTPTPGPPPRPTATPTPTTTPTEVVLTPIPSVSASFGDDGTTLDKTLHCLDEPTPRVSYSYGLTPMPQWTSSHRCGER